MTSIQQKLNEALKKQGFKPKFQKPPESAAIEGEIITIVLSDVEGKEIQWFWPNRIPSGMLSLLVGNPGVGKSFLTMYICSRVSTGEDWPDAENAMEPGSVLLFSDEESLEYAIKPRLDAHQADCRKIFAVPHIKKEDGNPDSFTIDEHIQLLREHLEKMPDCRLIIFDPITAYLGAVNANNNAEVRGALIGLQSLAQEKNVTILGINHFSKKAELDAIHRILGSTGFVAAARAVWAVIQESYRDDFEGEPGRLLIPVKSNYSIAPTALKFQIVDSQIVFEDGQHQINIDALLQNAKKKGGRQSNKKDAIATWLKERVGDEPVLADDLQAEAEGKGFAWSYVQKVATEIGIVKTKSAGHDGKSVWNRADDNISNIP
ncbi:MAG: AAA family ATPase [Phycisphaerae bacterium]|nr:AAA family ATPase [Phycisphaerae bacterium]